MARANESDMDKLHGALCSYFLKLIEGIERKGINEVGEVVVLETLYPAAGELAVMAKFLKDNAITGAAVLGTELSALEQKLAEKHQRRGKLPTPADVQAAMREIGSDLLQ